MMFKTQILAIWSIVMLLLPASAIYIIDNYETGVSREVIEQKGIASYSEGYVGSLPDGETVSTLDRSDFEAYWQTVNVDDTYWDTAIYGKYPFLWDMRGRDTVATIGDVNYVVANNTGFATDTTCYNFWLDITAYDLAKYDALALNMTAWGNITTIDNVWFFAPDGTTSVEIYGSDHIKVDNNTRVWLISLEDKEDLLALDHDARVWVGIELNEPFDYFEWSVELLSLGTEYGVAPLISWGIVLMFTLTTSVYMMIFASDIIDIKLDRKKGKRKQS